MGDPSCSGQHHFCAGSSHSTHTHTHTGVIGAGCGCREGSWGWGGGSSLALNLSRPRLCSASPRKKSLLVNNVFVLAAAALFGFSRRAGSFEMIMLGRLLVGISAGTGWVWGPFLPVAPYSFHSLVSFPGVLTIGLFIFFRMI